MYVYVCICMCIHTLIYTHKITYVYIYTHTHTYTYDMSHAGVDVSSVSWASSAAAAVEGPRRNGRISQLQIVSKLSGSGALADRGMLSRDEWLLQNHSYTAGNRNWQADVHARYNQPSLGTGVRNVAGGGLSNVENSRDMGRASHAWPPGGGATSSWTQKWQLGVTPSVLPSRPHHTSRPQSRS